MDILIKSFNRAYYLDRCIHSIYKFLKKFEGSIYVLDDGTPEYYLKKIKLKYPDVIIVKSDNYDLKTKLIESGNYELPEIVPSELWYISALNISEYFLVLEDDIWFDKTVDVSYLESNCKKEDITLLKLFWVSNKNVIGNETTKDIGDILIYKPKVQFSNPRIFKIVYTKSNFLWRKLFRFLGLYSVKKELDYYSMYSVAGAVFKKEYYLSLWENTEGVINEKEQLIRAIKYNKKHKAVFGRTRKEVLKIGFMSSAFSKYSFSEFNVHDFNKTLNQYWFLNDGIFNKNLGFDIDESDIKNILKSYNKSENYVSEWENWVNCFKESYRNIGCDI